MQQETPLHLEGLRLPNGVLANLDLHPIAPFSAQGQVFLDGAPLDSIIESAPQIWSGTVSGKPLSEVFLAFSPSGSRGWIKLDGELFHLLAEPGASGDWSTSISRWASEQTVRALGANVAGTCLNDQLPKLPAPKSASGGAVGVSKKTKSGGILAATAYVPIFEARIAVETDYQFFQLFGNLAAAQNYALTLLGAVSSRYREQLGVILTFPYLGMHSSSNDGWTSQDVGGSSIDLLYEFQAAWQSGNGPISADLYHFLSGAGLGGGVAYLPGLCDQDYGFGVSGDLGGVTPFPVIPFHPLNWDFIVVAHEMGHNFNSPHTHDLCPPVDQCAPAGYFGSCQTQQLCTSEGTIMSYCHLCAGGFENETTYFHQACLDLMHPFVETSCLQLFAGIFGKKDLGFAKSGSGGTPTLDVSYTDFPSPELNFAIDHAPASKPGYLILSTSQGVLPFGGGIIIPTLQFLLPANSSPLGSAALTIPLASVSIPGGVTLYAHGWYLNSPGYAATNALKFELILP